MISFEQEMDLSNGLALEMIRALNKKSASYPKDTPDVVLLYGSIFAMIEVADQLNTPKGFLFDVVESALHMQAEEKAFYKRLNS